MNLRREVEARGASALEVDLRASRIARLERGIAQRHRVIDAHRKRIDRLLGSKDLRGASVAIKAQEERIARQGYDLSALRTLRGYR